MYETQVLPHALQVLKSVLYSSSWRCAAQRRQTGMKKPDVWAQRVSGCALTGVQRNESVRSIGAVRGALLFKEVDTEW